MVAETSNAEALMFPDSYLLNGLDLYNWGPFAGRHHIDIDNRGTAIIGATGSGKTTLVDALMTLICERPKYNLASTGGLESDRDLVSYIRGKSGEGNNIDDSHIARPNKTLSAIAASFSNGDRQLQVTAIFWIDGSSSAQSDLKRIWIFDQSEQQDFDNLLELHYQGGSKAIKQHAKATPNLSARESKKAYLAQLRRFFDVTENAFTLLNRAAGLKQLNSIDELFRELVLDDNAAFERASEVVKGFDTLTSIHEELVVARTQRDALQPIKTLSDKYDALADQRKNLTKLLRLMPTWYAEQRYRLLSDQAEKLAYSIGNLKAEIEDLQRKSDLAEQEVQSLQSAYLSLGGGNVEDLQRNLVRLRNDRMTITTQVKQYQQLMRQLGLDETLNVQSFNANKPLLKGQKGHLEEALDERKQPWHAAISQVQNLKKMLEENRAQLQQVTARPSSNLPPVYQSFRSQLAEHLGAKESDLPYLAELIEVKADHSIWRGAIERAIGANRLRILVPEQMIKAALSWINERDNRLDVRLLEVAEVKVPPRFLDNGFVCKLNFKKHQLREGAKELLAGIDRHCVESTEALRGITYGITKEGTMSGKRGYFEKRDSNRLDQNWMTGFDNRDRLAQLRQVLQQGEDELNAAQQKERDTEKEVKQVEQQQVQLDALLELTFCDIDINSHDREIEIYEQHLQTLLDPESDTEKARQRLEAARKNAHKLSGAKEDKRVERGAAENQLEEIERKRKLAFKQVGKGLIAEQRDWLDQQLSVPDINDVDLLTEVEKNRTAEINKDLLVTEEKLTKNTNDLVRHMGKAKAVDTGALTETGSELQDIPDYLARLDTLIQEALPEKEKRFLEYLRNASDQSVTQLLSGVENEVNIIEERIEDLNETMLQVDFQPGRYLSLEPQRVVHESIRTLTKAQRHLNSARFKDDKGESHYKALQQVVALVRNAAENRRKVGARALLDPRYRLQFKGAVVERDSQRIINSFGGSQGGSGGEKEIIASYILTASLSYALCPQGARRPLFGSIILDEAFSKSSQAVASRIVSALRQFGLHPLFVTPNKEMQLLRTHTRSAVLIHRKGSTATTTVLSWEELRDKALQVKQVINKGRRNK
ncbi:MAG: ATP-binding protein [Candidatus Thiodiazotropha sp.]